MLSSTVLQQFRNISGYAYTATLAVMAGLEVWSTYARNAEEFDNQIGIIDEDTPEAAHLVEVAPAAEEKPEVAQLAEVAPAVETTPLFESNENLPVTPEVRERFNTWLREAIKKDINISEAYKIWKKEDKPAHHIFAYDRWHALQQLRLEEDSAYTDAFEISQEAIVALATKPGEITTQEIANARMQRHEDRQRIHPKNIIQKNESGFFSDREKFSLSVFGFLLTLVAAGFGIAAAEDAFNNNSSQIDESGDCVSLPYEPVRPGPGPDRPDQDFSDFAVEQEGSSEGFELAMNTELGIALIAVVSLIALLAAAGFAAYQNNSSATTSPVRASVDSSGVDVLDSANVQPSALRLT